MFQSKATEEEKLMIDQWVERVRTDAFTHPMTPVAQPEQIGHLSSRFLSILSRAALDFAASATTSRPQSFH